MAMVDGLMNDMTREAAMLFSSFTAGAVFIAMIAAAVIKPALGKLFGKMFTSMVGASDGKTPETAIIHGRITKLQHRVDVLERDRDRADERDEKMLDMLRDISTRLARIEGRA